MVKDMFFSSSHVRIWQMDNKECWAPKNQCFWIVKLGKTLESPLDYKKIKPVNPKGYQPRIFTERTVAKGEAPILWPPDAKSWLTGKDPDAGKIEGRRRRATENEMVGSHQLIGHEFEQTLGDSEGQGSLACAVHGITKSQTTEYWTTAYLY